MKQLGTALSNVPSITRQHQHLTKHHLVRFRKHSWLGLGCSKTVPLSYVGSSPICSSIFWTMALSISSGRSPLSSESLKTHAKDLKDYQPAALTSVLYKCMERVVCDQLSNMLSN